jgi:hypothetical protein
MSAPAFTVALDSANRARAHSSQVLQNTSHNADSGPDSAAFARPYSVKVSGWQMGRRASMAAQRCVSFEHLPAHPLPLQNGASGSQSLTTEPETMTTKKAGTAAAIPTSPHTGTPPHYLRRKARHIVVRAAVNGRLSWHIALPLLDKIGGGV